VSQVVLESAPERFGFTRESLSWKSEGRTARQDARRSGKEDAEHTLIKEECRFVFYEEHNDKIEGVFQGRDVKGKGLVGTWRLICDWSYSDSVLSKTAIFPQKEGRKREICNLHGVRRFARPKSRWAPQAHRMMGKTQWRHCERSFGTNVLVLGKQRDNFPLLSEPLKTETDVNENVVIERFLN